MKRNLKRNWVAALRSGKYRQTTEVLLARQGDREAFCCLGVLCEAMGVERNTYGGGYVWTEYGDDHYMEMELGLSFLRKVGLTADQEQEPIRRNDDLGMSFKEIADYIEKEIPDED